MNLWFGLYILGWAATGCALGDKARPWMIVYAFLWPVAAPLLLLQKFRQRKCPECGERFGAFVVDDRRKAQCRYVPSWMEPPSEEDPFETVTVGEVYYRCPSCNEVLDVELHD